MATHSSGEFHGHRSPWGCKELDTTERLTHTWILTIYLYISTPKSIFSYTQYSIYNCYSSLNNGPNDCVIVNVNV